MGLAKKHEDPITAGNRGQLMWLATQVIPQLQAPFSCVRERRRRRRRGRGLGDQRRGRREERGGREGSNADQV